MPLTTYDEVRPWARAIKSQVLARRMPKWHAARGYGAFANDPTLTPFESGLLVSWVDGGLPEGPRDPNPVAPGAGPRRRLAPRDTDWLVPVRSGQTIAVASRAVTWISAWSFEPGDPLITSARIDSSSGAVGTWVAGDGPVTLPAGTAIRIAGTLRVELQRRPAADFEAPFTPRPSLLRFRVSGDAAPRRVLIEQLACGASRTAASQRAVSLLAIRPQLERGASARVWLQRPGSPASILGWFRAFEPEFARTYWLARPVDLTPDARVQSDASCTLQLTVALPR